MSTFTSAASLQRSSPARGAAEYPPSSDFGSKIQKCIDAIDFSSAVNLLIFSIGQVNLSHEKEAIFEYLFFLLPHHDEEQYTQLCERLPLLLEVARDDPHKQSRLAQQLAERFMALTKELSLEQRLEYFISAQHFIAKAMKMESVSIFIDPTAIKKCHQTASKHFVTLIFELLVKNRAFQMMIDEARRKTQVDRVRAHVQQLEDLMRLCCDEEDHKMIRSLQHQAIEVANVRNDESQECFVHIFARIEQPFSLPACFSTERYQNALHIFREDFDILDSRDIRAAQKRYFTAFRTFFKVLIDDILAIMGPPPCGFDLRAMGSIGREEVCPFSDLECLILIAEDTPKIREYFSLFVKILELQMAGFGETPGAIPFSFTCLHSPEMKGLYLDLSPRKEERLIATPASLAILQNEQSLEGPTSIQHTVLRTRSLYATDPTLHDTYQQESQRVILTSSEDPLKQRALQHIEIRQTDYQRIWPLPFSSTAEPVQLKTQFIEPLFHLLGDLALYDHIRATNTLDIIDALGDRFNADSQTLLKEAVSFLYALRIDVQRFYSEQKEEIYFPSHQTLQRHFVANQSIIHSLEKVFYLVIFPLYHVRKLTSIQSFDLVNVAMTQAFSDPYYTQNPKRLIPLLRQTALFLERTHAPAQRHVSYYRHIGEISMGETLWQTYIDNLKDHTLIALLSRQPNSVGFRQEKRLREETLFASVRMITTPNPPGEGPQVQVTAPCIEGPRYLHPDVAKQILNEQGRIISRYESKHRVTSLVWQEHKLHFKMWPSHPLMEYALFDLYYRITGQLSPANILARFTAVQDDKTIHYPVLISETLDFPTLSKKAAEGDPFSNLDVKQWSWLILCSILTRTGDGRLSNYVISDHGKIYAVDNDIVFVFPTQESLLFSQINFACVLFFLSQRPLALDPEVLKEFLSLDFDLILSSWLEEVIVKEKEYNALFNDEKKPVVLEVPPADIRSPEKDSFTSSILFPPGAIVACRLQAARLKRAIIRAEKANSPVFCFDLLKEFISLRTDLPLDTKVGERVFRAYMMAQKQPTVATRYAAAIGRKAASSLTMAEFQKASFQSSPSQEEIERATYSPEEARKELLMIIGQVDDQVSSTTSATGRIILQGHFAHLRSAAGPNIMRQELVLKYIAHLLESSATKPTCVTLRDCVVLNRTNLLPFLHPNVKILDLRNSPQITSRCLSDIAIRCPQLEELYLCRANIGAFPPTLNFSTVQFPKLRVLQITESPRLTSMQLYAPQLEYLDLSSNPQLETLFFVAHSFPKIVCNNYSLVPVLPIGDFRRMLTSERGLCNAVEFFREIFRNLIGDERVLISNDDDIAYFEAIGKNRTSILSSLIKIKETTRRQLLDAAHCLHTSLIERLRSLADDIFPSLPHLEKEWLSICVYLQPKLIPTYFLDEWLKSEHPGENVLEKRDVIWVALSTDQTFLIYDSSTATYSIPRRVQEIVKDKDRDSSYVKACHLLIRLWNQIDFDNIRDWEMEASKADELYFHSISLMSHPKFTTLSEEDQAVFYSKMGDTKYIQGKYSEALEQHERALAIRQKALVSNHPDIAQSLSNIGCCLYSQGKHQEALEKFERALVIKRKSLDPNHPDIATSLHNIGNCLCSQGKYEEGLETHLRALEIWQTSLDPNHPDIATSLDNIGCCLFSQGKYQEALEKHKSALEIRRKSLDPNHPDIAHSLNNMGNCLYAQGKYQEALEKHQRALEIQRKSLDPNHPAIAMSLRGIGNCLYSQGKYQEALEKNERALAIQQKSLDPNHPAIATSLNNIVLCLNKLGDGLYSQGKYQEALKKYERALAIQRKSLDPNHPDIATSLFNIVLCLDKLGDGLYSQGKYQEALEKFERALEIEQKILDPNHPNIATSLNSIGNCLYSQGKYQEALERHERALEIRRKALDPNHPDIAFSLDHIGGCLHSLDKHQEALEKHERALEILQKALDPNHPDIATIIGNIGCCLGGLGKYQEALEKHERALEIRRKALDPNHPAIARSLNNIGVCLYYQGKYQEALEKHQRALAIQRKSLDPNHLDIATSLCNIGDCLKGLGKYQEALEKHQRALVIRQKSLDPNHPAIAKSLHEVGICLHSLGRDQEALEKHQRALEIQRKSQGLNHPDIARIINCIGSCLEGLGKYQEALEKYQRALEIRQKALNPNHPDIANSLNNIGSCLHSLGRDQEALEKYQRALEIRQKALNPNHPDIANSLNNIGSCLYSQGKYQEALEKLERALEIRRKAQDPNHPDIAHCLYNIGVCLEAQGKYQEALEKLERALAIRRKSLPPNHPAIAKSLRAIKRIKQKLASQKK